MSDITIEAPKRRGPLYAIIAAVVAVLVVAGFLIFGGGDSDAKGKTIKIGVVGAADPYWDTYKKAAADEGIKIKLVNFTDYAQPNPALAEGELDINQFQHLVFLADYNVSNHKNLTPIGATAIYPLGLYSKKYQSTDQIKAGDTVAVPSDVSNQARGLLILQSKGLIKLKDGGTIFSDLSDIDTDASKVKVKALDAALTASSLDDLAAAVVNNDFVEKAGLKFSDAIAQDDPSDPTALPYVNVFAVRPEDKDNKTYQKLVKIFQTDKAVIDGLIKVSGDTAVPATTPVSKLVASLKKVETDTAANKK